MRFLRRIGWLCVLIKTPAWALRKISFSSNTPEIKKKSIWVEQAGKAREENEETAALFLSDTL